MNSVSEQSQAKLSPFGNLFAFSKDDYFLTNYERYAPACWSAERVESTFEPKDDEVKLNTSYDLLTGTAITYRVPAIELTPANRDKYRFRFAEGFQHRLLQRGTIGDVKNPISTVTPFIGRAIEQTFVPHERRQHSPDAEVVFNRLGCWSASHKSSEFTVTQHWPFSINSGKAIEIFRFANKGISFRGNYNLKLSSYIQIQQRREDNTWVDVPNITEVLCKSLFSEYHTVDQAAVVAVNCSYKIISDEERQERNTSNTAHIYHAIELPLGNAIEAKEAEHLRSLVNTGMTVLTVFGAENITLKSANYTGSYTDNPRDGNKGSTVIAKASISHTFGDSTDTVFDATPHLLSSHLFTRHLAAAPDTSGIYAYSFVDRFIDGVFMGGCYTKGCKTNLSLDFRSVDTPKYPTQSFSLQVMILTIKNITYNDGGYTITNE